MLFTARYISDCNIESAESWKLIILRLRHTIYLISALIATKTHLASMIRAPCEYFSVIFTLISLFLDSSR